MSKMLGEANTALARIRNSANAPNLGDVREQLEQHLDVIKNLMKFQGLLSQTTPEPEIFFESKRDLAKTGIKIGMNYDKFELVLRGRQAMMRNDCSGLLVLCSAQSAPMQQLQQKGRHFLRASVSGMFEIQFSSTRFQNRRSVFLHKS